jgi:hypothetical protein
MKTSPGACLTGVYHQRLKRRGSLRTYSIPSRPRQRSPQSTEQLFRLEIHAALSAYFLAMKILHVLGVLFIVAWLVLWLALKLTFMAIHALAVIGVLLIIVAFVAGRSAASKT